MNIEDYKKKLKIEILEKINNILENNQIADNLDTLTVLNLNDKISYLGNIKIFDDNKLEKIEKEMKNSFKKYESFSLNSREVISCCRPPYNNISFKIDIDS